MPYFEIAIALVFATVFLKGGEQEARMGRSNHGVLWAALSVLVSVLVVVVIGRGGIWLIAAQLTLFVAIGAVRAHWERDGG